GAWKTAEHRYSFWKRERERVKEEGGCEATARTRLPSTGRNGGDWVMNLILQVQRDSLVWHAQRGVFESSGRVPQLGTL
ncbi:hypothetical protein PGIGA_G00183270, partial [Pangasianodon gigas]|nr:hypothetical protein [Pangasianodon gigas]